MTRSHSVAQSILDHNHGRDPGRLHRKFKLLRQDPFAFFRGTCHLFYATLPRSGIFTEAPAVLTCGDLHLENFGTYKGDNRLVYFDLNDFDEAALAPFTLELARFVTSVWVAAAHVGLAPAQAATLCRVFLDRYTHWIADGKPRWLERSTADGMVRDLLRALKQRERRELLDLRTKRGKSGRRLRIDHRHALPLARGERERITAFLKRFGAASGRPDFYRVLDVARRIAGNGSLGLERYVLLVEGRGSPDENHLLDLKLAAPSALAPTVGLRQPRWESEAQRVVTIQRIVQAISPALLQAVTIGHRSYILKELQPTADRLDLARWNGRIRRLERAIASMAEVTAWSQLRSCGRHGAAAIEDLQHYVATAGWQRPLLALSTVCSRRVVARWQTYCKAYDRGVFDAATAR